MAKKTYVGIDNLARKVRKMYVGVDNTARKIRKAYIGVNNVAQCIFATGVLEYRGTATPLSIGRHSGAGATLAGKYALFAGGRAGDTYADAGWTGSATETDLVEAYDRSLTRINVSEGLKNKCMRLAGTGVGDYVLFGGGFIDGGNARESTVYSTVTVYDKSLTRIDFSGSIVDGSHLTAVTLGGHAIFAGGRCINIKQNDDGTYTYYYDTPYIGYSIFDSSLTRIPNGGIDGGWWGSGARWSMASATVGNYALFGGGRTGTGDSDMSYEVEAIDTSITLHRTVGDLSRKRTDLAAAKVGDYALFAGGYTYNNSSFGIGTNSSCDTVDAYNSSLTRSAPEALWIPRHDLCGASLGEYALFAGGDYKYDSTIRSQVDVYDASLTRTNQSPLSAGRNLMMAATVGDYALFAGGRRKETGKTPLYTSSAVDVYRVS